MTAALSIEVDARPFERLTTDVAVAGFHASDRPLRGAAARVDWRLCGLVSSLLRAGDISGNAGEAVLLSSQGRLLAPKVLLLGLGPRETHSVQHASALMIDVIERCAGIDCERIGLSPLGIASDDFPRHAAAWLAGAADAVRSIRRPISIQIALPAPRVGAAVRALREARVTLTGLSIQVAASADLTPRRPLDPRGPAPHLNPS